LKNLSTLPWKVDNPNGEVIEIYPNQSFSLVPGTLINFGTSKGMICY